MDNNIFLFVFKNKVLHRYIFESVRFIHNKKHLKSLPWYSVLYSPKTLLSYRLFSEFKELLESDEVYFPFGDIGPYLKYAFDHFPTIQYVHSKYPNVRAWTSTVVLEAAVNGSLEVVKFINENQIIKNFNEAFVQACIYDRLEVVEYLYPIAIQSLSVNDIESVILTASKKGYFDIIKFLFDRGHIKKKLARVIESASVHQQYKVLEYLIDSEKDKHLLKFTPKTLNMFAKYGQLDLLQRSIDDCDGNSTELEQTLDYAASGGQFEVLKWLTENKRGVCTTRAIDKASGKGHYEIVRYLHENRSEGCFPIAMDEAAKGNHIEIVRFLHENRSEGCTVNAINNAAKYGHFKMIRFLVENRTERFSTIAVNNAALNGYYDLAVYLYDLQPEKCNALAVLVAAAKGGHIDIVKYFFDKIVTFNRSIKEVLKHPNEEIFNFLFREKRITFEINLKDIENMIKLGSLEGIKFLYERSPHLFGGYAFTLALEHKQLGILDYLYNNCHNIVYYKSLLTNAILTRDDDIIKYVLSMDIDVIQDITRISDLLPDLLKSLLYWHSYLSGTSLEMFINKYLEHLKSINTICLNLNQVEFRLILPIHRLGINLMTSVHINHAIISGNLRLVRLFNENNPEGFEDPYIVHNQMNCRSLYLNVFKYLYPYRSASFNTSLLLRAAEIGSLETIEFLHQQQSNNHQFTTSVMDAAAGHGHLDIVKFLHYNRTEGCSKKAFNSAATYGKLEIFDFLHKNRTEGCSPGLSEVVAKNGYYHMVKYIHNNRTDACTDNCACNTLR
ncbi:hypothetical protein PPL_09867 [Heterostelium album PN500]|uniref:Ankyrin repeat protein n=1 Tax=Heterostelium pallidum (strain ATCC 26659 / Pp 5 / PN500) TaxID=670386 RepID=D3BPA4_HETP5|nr:hypothetical protein PPL_09867 [Heterostelium album PN500]EFA77114.1 hypothetical protein PPL_09867 [Heterostelium album PN500]|eukprot:XP_020429243.1 hypothetical protein PPL_09867 [Heterostelium album PN500]